jgi:hypothetical protein
MGVCSCDKAFEPFWDDIIEESDFSVCYELYLAKRFDGERGACDQFEEIEVLDLPEGVENENIITYLHLEEMRSQDMGKLLKCLYDPNYKNISRAVTSLCTYINIGNMNAYEGLLKYYMGLGPAKNLEDTHLRIKIVDALSVEKLEKSTIEACVHELARTPSNNTTRQLYTLILKYLGKCPNETIREPLIQLLEKRQYSYRMKKRIMELIEGKKTLLSEDFPPFFL